VFFFLLQAMFPELLNYNIILRAISFTRGFFNYYVKKYTQYNKYEHEQMSLKKYLPLLYSISYKCASKQAMKI
jgi:hypothetical protein